MLVLALSRCFSCFFFAAPFFVPLKFFIVKNGEKIKVKKFWTKLNCCTLTHARTLTHVLPSLALYPLLHTRCLTLYISCIFLTLVFAMKPYHSSDESVRASTWSTSRFSWKLNSSFFRHSFSLGAISNFSSHRCSARHRHSSFSVSNTHQVPSSLLN